MVNTKETAEFVNVLADTAVQSIESFKDGAQLSDLSAFLDEATDWSAGIRGLTEGFPLEAKVATPEDVENLFEPQRTKLVNVGVNAMLAGAIVTNLKGIYYTYAAVVQSGQNVIEIGEQV